MTKWPTADDPGIADSATDEYAGEDDLLPEELVRVSDAERAASATEEPITGTCAFCHRHFANVERHVATKHPNETA